jgi:hypothetical protein
MTRFVALVPSQHSLTKIYEPPGLFIGAFSISATLRAFSRITRPERGPCRGRCETTCRRSRPL